MRALIGGLWTTLALLAAPGLAQEPAAPRVPPSAEHPNGDVYPDALLCPDDIPLAARRGTIKVQTAGREIDVVVYAPTGAPNGRAVVMLHGASGLSSTFRAFDPRALQLASRGYYVATPQYYDATGRNTSRGGRAMNQWRDVADDVAGVLMTLPGMQQGRVGVWGFSLGGWLAAEGAMTHDSLSSAVAVSSGTDVAPAKTDRRHIPILMVNARRDPVISFSSSRAFASSLRARGAEVDARELASGGHFLELPLWCQTFTWSREFFDRTLAPTMGPEAQT